jgi:LysR family cyn operon transcriptional activator
MNLELYRYFYHVARSGSISRAAESLYITQPALSRAVRQLEDEMGCSLFHRTPKGVKLTPEGSLLYTYIEQAFNFITAAEKKIADTRNLLCGEVRIGVSDTLCRHYLIPYLKLFNTLHPAININVVCPTTPGIIALLKGGSIDFGIINMPFSDEALEFKNIMEVQDCFVVGEKYRRLSHRMQPLKKIAAFPLLMLEKASNTRLYIDRYFRENGINLTPAFELGTMDLLVRFAQYDFGIACVIRNFVEDELEAGSLHEVKPIEAIPPRSIGVAWLKDVPLSTASRELISILDYNETSDI